MITLGTRAIVELERYIRDTFTDCVKDCNICKRLCVRVGVCLFTRGMLTLELSSLLLEIPYDAFMSPVKFPLAIQHSAKSIIS